MTSIRITVSERQRAQIIDCLDFTAAYLRAYAREILEPQPELTRHIGDIVELKREVELADAEKRILDYVAEAQMFKKPTPDPWLDQTIGEPPF